jgi:hypothetical protein
MVLLPLGDFGFQKNKVAMSQIPLRSVPAPDTIGRLNLEPRSKGGRIVTTCRAARMV